MNGRSYVAFGALILGSVVACDKEEEAEDPRPILDACDLPKPCGVVSYPANRFENNHLVPLGVAACMHDVLQRGERAHLSGRTEGYVWDQEWDLYLGGAGAAVLVRSSCGVDGEDPPPVTCFYHLEQCVLKPIDEIEC